MKFALLPFDYKNRSEFYERFQIDKSILCQGGQAVIKKGYDKSLEKTVAIKVFSKNKMSVCQLR